ncbi:MAG: HD domain-containing protein [Clostridia bacterium]|nr:HD domain-containing protein [Clostridia bacterium]
MITFEDIRKDEEVNILIETAEKQLIEIGYTEHGLRHVGVVSSTAAHILKELGYPERECELARIAGQMHDIGNAINRNDHAHTGAIMAYHILKDRGMDLREAAQVMMAIGNHDEATGTAVSPISAALILADKSDVHRTRVRNQNKSRFDIHDRVNYAVEESKLEIIDAKPGAGHDCKKEIILKLKIDTEICPVIKYFEIFLTRMLMCKNAASFLGIWFHLEINGSILL